jgi:hypothetical protein
MDIYDEADAAGVMLEGGIVEALLRRRAGEAGFLVFHGILCFPCAYPAPVTTLEKPGEASGEKYPSTAKSHNEFLRDFRTFCSVGNEDPELACGITQFSGHQDWLTKPPPVFSWWSFRAPADRI